MTFGKTQPASTLKEMAALLEETLALLERMSGAEGVRDIPFFNARLKLRAHIWAVLYDDKSDDASNAVRVAMEAVDDSEAAREREHCARTVEDLASMHGQELRLRFGEMSAQEERTSRAMLRWAARELREADPLHAPSKPRA